MIVKRKGCSEIDCSKDWAKSRKKIMADTNKCVEKCPESFSFLFDSKCFPKCPDGSYPDRSKCLSSSNQELNDEGVCTIKKYFLHKCKMNLQTPSEKIMFIENTVNGILHSDLYDLVLMAIEDKKNFVIKEENVIYQIYALNNKNIREQNLTYIDFENCASILRETNKLTQRDDIIVFKIEYTSPDFKIPIIEYVLFGVYGTKKLNLLSCNNIKFNYYIPKEINNYEDYKYDPNNNYYKDKCLTSSLDNMVDLTVKDRIEIFNDNNMSLCESICTYKGYEYNNIICECSIKTKFNSFNNVNVSKYNLIYRFDEAEADIYNFWVFKCLSQLFSKDAIIKNACSLIILGIIFIIFVSIIIFCLKENSKLGKQIYKVIELTLIKKNKNNSSEKSDIFCFNNSGSDSYIFNNSILSNENNMPSHQRNKNTLDKNNFNKNRIKKLKEKKLDDEYTENELNNLSYFVAILEDNRSFLQIYFSLIKTKHLLIFIFGCKKDYNPRTMKVSFMLLIFAIFLVFNTIFVNDTTLHDLFIYNGKIGFLSNFNKIWFSILISTIIKNILMFVSFPENDILKIKKIVTNNVSKRNQEMQELKSIVMIRCYIFFFVNIIILSFIWIYIVCFFMIFKNTQIYVIKNTLISFAISMLIPFISYFIPAYIKKFAIKGNISEGNYCLYILSTILQIIL